MDRPTKQAAEPCTLCYVRECRHSTVYQVPAGHWLCTRCHADYHAETGKWELETVEDADRWEDYVGDGDGRWERQQMGIDF